MDESGTIGKAHHAAFQACDITNVLLVWYEQGCVSAIACLSYPDLGSRTKKMDYVSQIMRMLNIDQTIPKN